MTNPPQPPSVPTEKTEHDPRYRLWELLEREHNVIALESELDEIIACAQMCPRVGPDAPPAPTTGGGAGLRDGFFERHLRRLSESYREAARDSHNQKCGHDGWMLNVCRELDAIISEAPPVVAPSPVTGGTPDLAKEAVRHIDDILTEFDVERCEDIRLGSTAFNSLRRWARQAREALASGTPTTAGDSALMEELAHALAFCRSLSEEQLRYAKVGTGDEVALRHIFRKSAEVHAKFMQRIAAATSRRREEGK